jgi:hypothetical protein
VCDRMEGHRNKDNKKEMGMALGDTTGLNDDEVSAKRKKLANACLAKRRLQQNICGISMLVAISATSYYEKTCWGINILSYYQ